MSFLATVSSPAIHDYAPLNHLIEQLYSVPKENYALCIARIKEVGALLSATRDLAPQLNGRVNYIGSKLLSEIAANPVDHPLAHAETVLAEICNYKNALQVETVFYGTVYRALDINLKISTIPQLHEFWTEMPFMFKHIHIDGEVPDSLKVDLDPLYAYFASVDLDTLPGSFDGTMLQIFQQYPIRDGQMIISMNTLPPAEFLESYMLSSDFHSRLLAQLLFFCKIERAMILGEHTSKILTQAILDALRSGTFDSYLAKEPLIPILSHLLRSGLSFKASGKDPEDLLFDTAFLHETHMLQGPDWLEEASSLYERLRKIEIGVRRVFKPGTLEPIDARLLSEGCDKKVLMFFDLLTRSQSALDLPLAYPITHKHPFAHDKDEFKMLSLFHFMEKNYAYLEALRLKAEARELKAAAKGKKKGKKVKALTGPKPASAASGGGGGGGGSSAAYATGGARAGASVLYDETAEFDGGSDDDVDLETFCRIKPASKPASVAAVAAGASGKASEPSKAALLESSLKKAEETLKTFHFHRRVAAWQQSGEIGLEYYQFGKDGVSHDLERDEMILRHRLPKDLLLLAINPHYGVKKPVLLASGEVIREHYETCLLIDGKKYILEVSLNDHNMLFHFYARRVRQMKDFENMMTSWPHERASIQALVAGAGGAADEGHEFDGIDARSLSFDKDGNAACDFESHHFVVPILKPLIP